MSAVTDLWTRQAFVKADQLQLQQGGAVPLRGEIPVAKSVVMSQKAGKRLAATTGSSPSNKGGTGGTAAAAGGYGPASSWTLPAVEGSAPSQSAVAPGQSVATRSV